MPPRERGLDDYPDVLVQVAVDRLAAITPFLACSSQARSHVAIRAFLVTLPPSSSCGQVHPATVYRWLRAYQASQGDIRALIPRTTQRGGKGAVRLDPAVEILIQEAIRQRYLVREYRTIDDVWHAVAARVATYNTGHPTTNPLPCPSRRTIARRIAGIPPAERRRAKEGAAAAQKAVRQVNQTPYPERPLARVEMDHLILDLMTVDDQDHTPLGRLTLTYCLDTATCYPLGYSISFEPPSYWSVMECLYHAILPKSDGDTVQRWQASGIPEMLVVDQGKEFIGHDLSDACLALGITLTHAPVRTPEFKGRIERQFRRINDQLIHTLPGTTFATAQARGDAASLRQACLTLAEVDTLFTRYLLDIYAPSFHRGINGIPAQRWQTLTTDSNWSPRVAADADLVALALGRTAWRTVHHYGIELFGLRYNAPALGPLRDAFPGTPIKIKYHPGNLGSIAVYQPQDERYLLIPALASTYATGLALWKHEVIKRLARAEARSVDIVALGHAKDHIQAIAQTARRTTRSGRQRRGRLQSSPTPTQTAYRTAAPDTGYQSLLVATTDAGWSSEQIDLRKERS